MLKKRAKKEERGKKGEKGTSRSLGEGQGELVRFRPRSSGGWKIEPALLTKHYAGIRGSARQKRGEKAGTRGTSGKGCGGGRERGKEREREKKRTADGAFLSSESGRVSGSHPLFRNRAHPVPGWPFPPPL